jgi:hypothetical protein
VTGFINKLRRFGIGAHFDVLPTKAEFEKRLQKNTRIMDNLDARLTAIDVLIDVNSRQRFKARE